MIRRADGEDNRSLRPTPGLIFRALDAFPLCELCVGVGERPCGVRRLSTAGEVLFTLTGLKTGHYR